MDLKSFRHKGLKQFYEANMAKGIPGSMLRKLKHQLFALETADSLMELEKFPGWRLHPLRGDLNGFWSMTVTGNWRLIFQYDARTNSASEIDLTDYHGK